MRWGNEIVIQPGRMVWIFGSTPVLGVEVPDFLGIAITLSPPLSRTRNPQNSKKSARGGPIRQQRIAQSEEITLMLSFDF